MEYCLKKLITEGLRLIAYGYSAVIHFVSDNSDNHSVCSAGCSQVGTVIKCSGAIPKLKKNHTVSHPCMLWQQLYT